jgi:hypothetical protein
MDESVQFLEMSLDEILFQLSKGLTIEQLKKGKRWFGFEQVKEWKNRMGYKLHIYSNDHFINNKAHFHIVKEAESVDCKFDFKGNLLGCVENEVGRKLIDAIVYFCEHPINYKRLVQTWNAKNPTLLVS